MRTTLCFLALLAGTALLAQQQSRPMPPGEGRANNGQDQTMPKPNNPGVNQPIGTTQAATMNPGSVDQARDQIQTSLDADRQLKSAHVTAQVVDDHTIALTGTVPDKDTRDRAMSIAEKNSGDRTLVDHITIGSTSNPQ